MSSFFGDLIKHSGNEYASLAADGIDTAEVNAYYDTGSYILNAILSGTIFGGLPGNKITAFAGESATGKTFFVLAMVKQFLLDNPEGGVVFFETESAITKEIVESRGIDSRRLHVVPVVTVQEFKTQAARILDKYLESPESERLPMMFCLDSLGMLSTEKEMADTSDGKDVRDMTRSQVLKAAFRVLTLKLGRAKVPMLVTNHTYDVIGSYVPTKEMGGGSGLKYAADIILYLSKKKEKDGTEVIGNIIKCKNFKSRFTIENKEVQTLLDYHKGLNRYYGLLDLAEKYGIFKKVSTRFELPDGSKQFAKTINENPEQFFTEDILKQIDEHVAEDFKYGKY